MQVTDVTSAEPLSTTGSARKDLNLGYDAFIKLLLAQMKNQDPMEPMDSGQYVSQLATLSNLEQVIKQSEKLDTLIEKASHGEAASILGRRVASADGSVEGIVAAARILTDGVWVTLTNGAELQLGPGISISSP